MRSISHLTNEEAIQQLTLRDDLSELEQELLDRLVRATEEMNRLEREGSIAPADEESLSVIQP